MRPDGRTSSETKLKVARMTTIVIKVASVKGGLVIVAHLPKSDDRFTGTWNVKRVHAASCLFPRYCLTCQ
jgi:hypothetical protein